jgi:predicted short-subunit dehydrogenase-like oxidoreductase (DUF2520 family)
MADQINNVAIIGSGKVASALGRWLQNAGIVVTEIWSRNLQNAENLGVELNATAVHDLSEISGNNDLIIIAVKDDAIAEVSNQLKSGNAVVVHTSGARPISDLQEHSNCGVFYPLQTFSANAKPDFTRIPFCIEGSNTEVVSKLESFCANLGAKSYLIDSHQRSTLHLAAVIANNFTNHLWGKSRELLENVGIDHRILHPLMEETLQKAMMNHPFEIQTGPAVRNDSATTEKHLSQLSNDPIFADIYRLITQCIQSTHTNKS